MSFLKKLAVDLISVYVKFPVGIRRDYLMNKAYYFLSDVYDYVGIRITNKRTRNEFVFTLRFPLDILYARLLFTRAYELGTTDFIQRFLLPDDVIFDVGANIGYVTLLAATSVEKGKVFSFEPMPGTFERLTQNIGFNPHLNNITILNRAVSNQNGEIVLNSFENLHHGHSSISKLNRQDHIEHRVASTTIDNCVAENNLQKLDFIKIDVEGAEQMAFAGAKYTLARMKPTVLMEMNEETANANGFKCYELLELLSNISEYSFYRFPGASSDIQIMRDIRDYQHGDNVVAVNRRHQQRLETII